MQAKGEGLQVSGGEMNAAGLRDKGHAPGLLARMSVSPLVAILALILLSLIMPAVVFLIQSSVHETNFDGSFGEFTLRYYRELFTNDRFSTNLINATLYA
ncbi:MAG: hypothetical protein RLZ98_991, partial [Pseudomonadota bacterium]